MQRQFFPLTNCPDRICQFSALPALYSGLPSGIWHPSRCRHRRPPGYGPHSPQSGIPSAQNNSARSLPPESRKSALRKASETNPHHFYFQLPLPWLFPLHPLWQKYPHTVSCIPPGSCPVPQEQRRPLRPDFPAVPHSAHRLPPLSFPLPPGLLPGET